MVRGDDADSETIRQQAERFLRRFPDWGRFGISAYYARNDAEVDDLASDQLERFALLALFRTSDLESGDFAVVPTFRTPHVTIAFTGNLDERLEQLAALRSEVRANPYHDREP